MTVEIPAIMVNFYKTAQEKKFSQSIFACEAFSLWLWNQVQAEGCDDPEKSVLATEICSELGTTYLEMLELGAETLRSEINRCMAAAATDRLAFLRACTLVCAYDLAEDTELSIECDWSAWADYSADDSVSFPPGRIGLFYQELPYQVVELVFLHANTSLDTNPFLAFSTEMRRYFTINRSEFCFSRSILDEIDKDFAISARVNT